MATPLKIWQEREAPFFSGTHQVLFLGGGVGAGEKLLH